MQSGTIPAAMTATIGSRLVSRPRPPGDRLVMVDDCVFSPPITVPQGTTRNRLGNASAGVFWSHRDSLRGALKRFYESANCTRCRSECNSLHVCASTALMVRIHIVGYASTITDGDDRAVKLPPVCNHVRLIDGAMSTKLRLIAYLQPTADPVATQQILTSLARDLHAELASRRSSDVRPSLINIER